MSNAVIKSLDVRITGFKEHFRTYALLRSTPTIAVSG